VPVGDLAEGAPVVAAIRAEQIRLAASSGELGSCDTLLDGTVVDTIFEGERQMYVVDAKTLPGTTFRVYHHDPDGFGLFGLGIQWPLAGTAGT
jgi:putative spermidine/putrescine transport system ATP-binding protein